MSTMNLSPLLRQRFFDANGLPLALGKLYTYQANSTTPQATYKDAGAVGTNANPVVLDANGYADVWLDPTLSYKFILKDANDNLQWTVDGVVGSLVADSVATASIQDGAVTTAKLADASVTPAKLSTAALGPYSIMNLGLAAAVGSNNLVITLKDAAGNAPSISSVVQIPFRSATAATGTPVTRTATSALTMTLFSGSTLGSKDASPTWAYVYAVDNAGTVELAVSGSKAWDEGALQNTTAEGSGTATSAGLLYSAVARTGVAIRLIGRVKSTQATAGTWATAPSEISILPLTESSGWQSYTPIFSTGFGTVTGINFKWSRGSGNTLKVIGQFVSGTMTDDSYSVSLPNGKLLSSKLHAGDILGTFAASAAFGAIPFIGGSPGASGVNFYAQLIAGAYSQVVTAAGMPNAGTTYYMAFEAPIDG